jgi:hypothetical protein
MRSHLAQEASRFLDIFALLGPEAEVMKANAILHKGRGSVSIITTLDSQSRPATNPVSKFVTFEHPAQTEKRQESIVKA